MTDVGGVGAHDARRTLTTQLDTTGLRSMAVDIGYADESITLDGSPKDLETLFQLMHLQFTAPLLDSAVARRLAEPRQVRGVARSRSTIS